jgi:hypothetical protein
MVGGRQSCTLSSVDCLTWASATPARSRPVNRLKAVSPASRSVRAPCPAMVGRGRSVATPTSRAHRPAFLAGWMVEARRRTRARLRAPVIVRFRSATKSSRSQAGCASCTAQLSLPVRPAASQVRCEASGSSNDARLSNARRPVPRKAGRLASCQLVQNQMIVCAITAHQVNLVVEFRAAGSACLVCEPIGIFGVRLAGWWRGRRRPVAARPIKRS